MKEDVGYEEFLATVHEAETEAMMVKKVVEKKGPTNLQDLKQQIESLATIMKSAMIWKCKTKEGDGISSPKKKEMFQNSSKKAFKDHPGKERGS